MPDFYSLSVFVFVTALLAATPGPDFLFISASTAAGGGRHGMSAVIGVTMGCFFHCFLAALGVSWLIIENQFLFTAIKWFGACYLSFLAFQAFQASKVEGELQAGVKAMAGLSSTFFKGFLTNLFNPKAPVSIAFVFLAFIDLQEGEIFWLFMALGVIFCLTVFAVFTVLVTLIVHIHKRVAHRPAIRQFQSVARYIVGGLFILFALKLLTLQAP